MEIRNWRMHFHLESCLFLILACIVQGASNWKHVYYITPIIQTATVDYEQSVQSFLPSINSGTQDEENTVIYQTFQLNNSTQFSLIQVNMTYLMYYVVKSSISPPYANELWGYPLNTSFDVIFPSYCKFLDEDLVNGKIVAFNIGTNNTGLVSCRPSTDGSVLHLYWIDVFPRTNANPTTCAVTSVASYELQYEVCNQIIGASLDIDHSRYSLLHSTLGIIVLDLDNDTSTTYSPPNNLHLSSMAPQAVNGNLFVLANNTDPWILQVVFANDTVTFVNNTQALQSLPGGKLVVDTNRQAFFVYFVEPGTPAQPKLNIYGVAPGITYLLDIPWSHFDYYPFEPAYCPNGCTGNGNGACVDSSCACNSGWMGQDCSACDAVTFCTNHGFCTVNNYGNRTCKCNEGWLTPNCKECDSSILCSDHGSCQDPSGSCECDLGFQGANCSQCNSEILCHSHGQCNMTGQCECDEFWTGEFCLEYTIPVVTVATMVDILNYCTLIGWTIMFLMAVICMLLRSHPRANEIYKCLRFGIGASLVYFQSFVLLMRNELVEHVLYHQFKYYYLLMLDVYGSFSDIADSMWTESSLFVVKCLLFLVWVGGWNVVKSSFVRGTLLQIGLWFYFSLVGSLFERFQSKDCKECSSPEYVVPANIGSVFILCTLMYFKYRMWKVIVENKQYFESRTTDITYPECSIQKTSSKVHGVWKLLTFVFFPWSDFLSFFFARLCEAPQRRSVAMSYNSTVQTHYNAPPITPQLPNKKGNMHQPNSSVEDFITAVVKKINHDDLETSKIIAMLKGNWYTTVADLRTLSESDAEKLNIPMKLYNAIQRELPKDEPVDHYTRLDALVNTAQKEDYMEAYGNLGEDYKTSHVLFKLDELLARNFVWALLAAALTERPRYRQLVLLCYQTWYTGFVFWHEPYRRGLPFLVVEGATQFGVLINLILLIDLGHHNDNYWILLIIACLHFTVMLISTFAGLVFHYRENYRQPKDEPNRITLLHREDIIY